MGDPRKTRRKYSTPGHPWQKERIDRENKLSDDYGLKNKKELWRHDSMLKQFKIQAKDLISRDDKQAEIEQKLFMQRLEKLNLMPADSKLEKVLELKLENILNRRLQTMLVKKGLARTLTQARQFVVHGHVTVNGNVVDIPSYLLNAAEESTIQFDPKSPLSDSEHPERQLKSKGSKANKEEEKKEEEKEEIKIEKVKEEPKEEVAETKE